VRGAGAHPVSSERLILRRWREDDLAPFAAMNADATVMEHFPATLSTRESAELVGRIERGFERDGFGLWALELPDEATFIGFTGLARVRDDIPLAPAVELAWRLARPFWGRGLASEAAGVAARIGFEDAGLRELVAYTYLGNVRSRRVMKRLGMVHDRADDFEHPGLAPGHPLAPHVVYRIDAARWRTGRLEACAGATPTQRDRPN